MPARKTHQNTIKPHVLSVLKSRMCSRLLVADHSKTWYARFRPNTVIGEHCDVGGVSPSLGGWQQIEPNYVAILEAKAVVPSPSLYLPRHTFNVTNPNNMHNVPLKMQPLLLQIVSAALLHCIFVQYRWYQTLHISPQDSRSIPFRRVFLRTVKIPLNLEKPKKSQNTPLISTTTGRPGDRIHFLVFTYFACCCLPEFFFQEMQSVIRSVYYYLLYDLLEQRCRTNIFETVSIAHSCAVRTPQPVFDFNI